LDVIGKTQGRSTLSMVFRGFLTPTEQVMLSKRVMAGFLILSDWDAYAISSVLKLSVSTVYKLKHYLELSKDYRKFLEKLLPKKIPFQPQKGPSAIPPLVKLLENIFEGYRHRSRLLYS